MCGLAGFLCGKAWRPPRDPGLLAEEMAGRLRHRGPDSGGSWADREAVIALGHRRLAILDLSPLGHQPMTSPSGRYVAAYNGEIYNFLDVRRDLEEAGHAFRGHSDTEVMLAAIERWGLEPALQRFAGMFAIALWDREARELHLVRDRLGKKPLYVACNRGSLLFASELKAFHAFPGFVPEIDRDALTLLVRHAYVPDPHCIFQGCLKLPPGSVATIRPGDLGSLDSAGVLARARPYWSLQAVATRGQRAASAITESEATAELDRLLRRTVGERMISDVPLGAFLSGGIDSSLVTALMQAQSTAKIRTFTIGFTHEAYDEAADAKRVAAHLGTEHTELCVTAQAALDLIPQLPVIYDEPFADTSQIPTYLLCKLARQHVTVALSGDGGDEVFGGYRRYFEAERLAAIYRLPFPVRRALSAAALGVPPGAWNRALGRLRPMLPARLSSELYGERIHKLASAIGQPSVGAVYESFISQWPDPGSVVIGGAGPNSVLRLQAWDGLELPDVITRMMYLDSVSYLPGDILVKVDRASMARSLEARCPLLDHRVVEFAWTLPQQLKVRDGDGKRLLKQLLSRYVPRELFDRPKQGFGPPIGEWLRGPLRPWVEDLLDPARLRREGYLRVEPVQHAWAEHVSGRRSHAYALWNLLMFQAWHAHWQESLTRQAA